jgi:hypothetical protein
VRRYWAPKKAGPLSLQTASVFSQSLCGVGQHRNSFLSADPWYRGEEVDNLSKQEAAIIGEVIHEAAMAMRFHAKINDFIELLNVYPTMAEALKIVAISRRKDPAKLACCAE